MYVIDIVEGRFHGLQYHRVDLVHLAVKLFKVCGQHLVLDVHRLVANLADVGQPLAVLEVNLVDLLLLLGVSVLLATERTVEKRDCV